MLRERRMIQPPSVHTIHPKLQGRSWRYWSCLRDHYQTERSQGQVQEFHEEAEALRPTKCLEPWRNNYSGNITEGSYTSFKHINTYRTIHWWQERPNHCNDPNRRDKTLSQEKVHIMKKNIIRIYGLI